MSDLITLNIGGTCFTTTKTTLLSKDTFFNILLDNGYKNTKDEKGNLFIDHDPKHFPTILNYLRNGVLVKPDTLTELNQLEIDIDYFIIEECKPIVKKWISDLIEEQKKEKEQKVYFQRNLFNCLGKI